MKTCVGFTRVMPSSDGVLSRLLTTQLPDSSYSYSQCKLLQSGLTHLKTSNKCLH